MNLRFIAALMIVGAILLLSTPSVTAAYSQDYFAHTNQYSYPSVYFSPARTGLPSQGYFYPGKYQNSFWNFRNYRAYTHSAYRNPAVAYAIPYTGAPNPHYTARSDSNPFTCCRAEPRSGWWPT